MRRDFTQQLPDRDPQETREWIESLEAVVAEGGSNHARNLLYRLLEAAQAQGVAIPEVLNTPYVNTIRPEQEPPFPGGSDAQAIEERIASIMRWNALAMVVRANQQDKTIGGHIATYASIANLYEVGYNHFFRGKGDGYDGDQIYFQPHTSPGIYARAYLEGRLSEKQLGNFRHELSDGGGLSSYPHPWLMPDFWEFPTASMGLSAIMAIYQARFNRYLEDRGLKSHNNGRVWAFLGDGETDEPEALGAITLAAREKLDNLTFVINCNLQRLDGPVRGNGRIVDELEALFAGRPSEQPLQRLVDRGLVILSAFTPSDAAHVLGLQADPRFDCRVCVTGQHREMLDQVLRLFGIEPDYDLNVMKPGQGLTEITAAVPEPKISVTEPFPNPAITLSMEILLSTT
mgnify:CR=1 FL=1